jgi:hypothetical protein
MRRSAATSRTLAAPTTVRLPPGAEWLEVVIRAGVAGFGGPPHGDSSRWDWGLTAQSLGVALEKHARLSRILSDMTPDQRAALWSDTSPIAAELRRMARRC